MAGRERLAASADGSAGALLTAQPVAPANGSVVPALAGAPGEADTVELVWVAPAQAMPVRFFVQLLALDAAGTHEVFATYLDETATLAPLGRRAGPLCLARLCGRPRSQALRGERVGAVRGAGTGVNPLAGTIVSSENRGDMVPRS